jgi:hypothetical protein
MEGCVIEFESAQGAKIGVSLRSSAAQLLFEFRKIR